MSVLSLDKFVALIERSKLVENHRLAEAILDWKRRATLRELDDAKYCADHLVESGLITPWQSHKLLEGRHRGFFLGKYKLLDHLGTGGMSSVYLAEHVLMRRQAAIKVLPQNRVGDSAYLARFHFEAQAAAALDHPNIVRAYDLDNEGKIHYLVMEYVEGRDLDAVVSQDGPLDYHDAANVIWQAAAGLDHAHHCGLVHRDIKPANLLIDTKGTVKILDMGLAKFTNESGAAPKLGEEEHILGTADYLAPEQAVNSSTVDHRADVYALGCTLYYLLTGHPPFAVGTAHERMAAHQHQSPPSLLVDRPEAPEGLVAICRRMMEKDRERRYQSASEVRQSLGAWLEGERALGKVDARSLVLSGRGSAGPRQHGKSKANLVSGSASDLYPLPPEPPPFASPQQDTDCNLNRATVKMPVNVPAGPPRGAAENVSPSERDARAGAEVDRNVARGLAAPVPPPIVAPPLQDAKIVVARGIEPPLPPEILASESLGKNAAPLVATVGARRHRRLRRRTSASDWVWRLAVGAFLFFALGVAIAALMHALRVG
jgi:eukaryotic-like serine/threonine-protein kinase